MKERLKISMRFYAKDFEDKVIVCEDCGKEFKFPASEQAFYKEKDITITKRCRACRDKHKQKMEGRTLICKTCGQEFTYTREEEEFFKRNDLAEPKRCKKCRSKRRIHDKYYSKDSKKE